MDPHTPKLRLYPIVVGVNQYANGPASPLVTLQCAERDALRFTDFLREENDAFDTINFKPFIGADANAEHIRKQLRQRFANPRLTALDVIVLYFAGHGITTVDGKAFLCCYQASPRDPSNDGLRLDDLYNEMQAPDSEATVMLILDACYSGSIADPNMVNHNAAQQMRGLLGRMQPLGRGGRIVLAAAHSNQAARENPVLDEGGAGIFTSEVLRGWQRGAARNHDGTLTPESLSQYLQGQFKGSRDQQPVTSVTTGSSMIIGRFEPYTGDLAPVAPPPRRQITGTFDPDATYKMYDPPPPAKTRTVAEKQRQRNLIWIGASATVAVIAACTLATIISAAAFEFWFISAIALAFISLPLAARAGGYIPALFALLAALAEGVALVGLAHVHFGLGAGVVFLDALAHYSWLAVIIFIAQALFVVLYGALATANFLWSS